MVLVFQTSVKLPYCRQDAEAVFNTKLNAQVKILLDPNSTAAEKKLAYQGILAMADAAMRRDEKTGAAGNTDFFSGNAFSRIISEGNNKVVLKVDENKKASLEIYCNDAPTAWDYEDKKFPVIICTLNDNAPAIWIDASLSDFPKLKEALSNDSEISRNYGYLINWIDEISTDKKLKEKCETTFSNLQQDFVNEGRGSPFYNIGVRAEKVGSAKISITDINSGGDYVFKAPYSDSRHLDQIRIDTSAGNPSDYWLISVHEGIHAISISSVAGTENLGNYHRWEIGTDRKRALKIYGKQYELDTKFDKFWSDKLALLPQAFNCESNFSTVAMKIQESGIILMGEYKKYLIGFLNNDEQKKFYFQIDGTGEKYLVLTKKNGIIEAREMDADELRNTPEYKKLKVKDNEIKEELAKIKAIPRWLMEGFTEYNARRYAESKGMKLDYWAYPDETSMAGYLYQVVGAEICDHSFFISGKFDEIAKEFCKMKNIDEEEFYRIIITSNDPKEALDKLKSVPDRAS